MAPGFCPGPQSITDCYFIPLFHGERGDYAHSLAEHEQDADEVDDAVAVDVSKVKVETSTGGDALDVTHESKNVLSSELAVAVDVAPYIGHRRLIAGTGDFDVVDVRAEHIGHVIVTDSNADGLTRISGEIEGVLGVVSGKGDVGADLSAVDEYAEDLITPAGILALSPEGDLAVSSNGELRSVSPVVGSESADVVDVGLGADETIALVEVELSAVAIQPLPVVAVAVLINELPALSFGIGLEVPDDAGGLGGNRSRGGRNGGRGYALAETVSGDVDSFVDLFISIKYNCLLNVEYINKFSFSLYCALRIN